MSFLKKIFSKKDPVEEMRSLHAHKDWAGVLSVGKRVAREALDEELQAEIKEWEDTAGDALAKVNLEEGLWAHKSGNLLRAREDFQLAIEQASSSQLQAEAQQALAALEQGQPINTEAVSDPGHGVHAGCNSGCTPEASAIAAAEEGHLDEETRMELLLATMPPELAARYLAAGAEFRQAWLAAQDGDDEQAFKLLEKVPEAQRHALFLLERGALQARTGELAKAEKDLQAALTIEPELFPAFDTLVAVMATSGRHDELMQRLKQSLAAEQFVGYCWARLAELHAQRGEAEPALAAGLKALDEGLTDPGVLVLCAQLLEKEERHDEAEALLRKLPGGGCGGGVHPMLAEHWLRRGQNLNQALEAFKGAMRQEKDNPRWLLRISQVYLAKGWKKEAAEQVERLMHQGGLSEELSAEVKTVADACQNR